MNREPLVSQELEPANPTLWAVKSYLDLISRDDRLVYGDGLKRLYVMSTGLATYNEDEIEAATRKAEKMGTIPNGLYGFMIQSILKNCFLYGKVLADLIYERITSIANGDIRNPNPRVKFSPESARRYYYVPSADFVGKALKAINEDCFASNSIFSPRPTVTSIQDVANQADFILTQMQVDEGHIFPQVSTFGAIDKVIDSLLYILENEQKYPTSDADYKTRSRGALKILWFIAKLLLGDLTIVPDRKDLCAVDLEHKLAMTDGTLVAIPFPIPQSMTLFSDNDHLGVSMKGRIYLSAVAAASFDRS